MAQDDETTDYAGEKGAHLSKLNNADLNTILVEFLGMVATRYFLNDILTHFKF